MTVLTPCGTAETFGEVLRMLLDMPENRQLVWGRLAGCQFVRLPDQYLAEASRKGPDGQPILSDAVRDKAVALVDMQTPLMHMLMVVCPDEDGRLKALWMESPLEPRAWSPAIADQLQAIIDDPGSLPEPVKTDKLKRLASGSLDRLSRLQIGESIEDLKPRSWNPDEDHLWPSPIRFTRLADREIIRQQPGLSGTLAKMGKIGPYLGLFQVSIGDWSFDLFLFHNRKIDESMFLSATRRDSGHPPLAPTWLAHFSDLVLHGTPWRTMMKKPIGTRIDTLGHSAPEASS